MPTSKDGSTCLHGSNLLACLTDTPLLDLRTTGMPCYRMHLIFLRLHTPTFLAFETRTLYFALGDEDAIGFYLL